MRRVACLLILLATTGVTHAFAQGAPSVNELITRASSYAATFITRFSNVVAEEDYLQDVNATPFQSRLGDSIVPPRLYRRLKSDFLLVRPTESNAVVAFRDVFELDGEPVRDRDDRLQRLFIEATGTELERAGAIAAESAKFNLGNVIRDNNPLLVVGFLQPVYVDRFDFTLGRRERIDGRDVWVVNYVQTNGTTLLTSRQMLGESARGRIWLEPATGRPARTELVTRLVTVRVEFSFDEQLGVDVPVEMVEAYRQAGNPTNVVARGTARYSRFRQFEVTAQETIR